MIDNGIPSTHVVLSAMNPAYLTAIRTWAAQAVRAGDLSQQQADNLLSLQHQVVEHGLYVFLASLHGLAIPSNPNQQ